MHSLLELLKYTVPGLIVFATAYYILNAFLTHQIEKEGIKHKKELISTKIPLKLQAYERLMLFCERIRISNLVMRLRTHNMTNQELYNTLLISIQKEYEHNLTQQLYTTNSLWQIISLTKDDVLNMVQSGMEGLNPQGNATDLSNKLILLTSTSKASQVDTAISAIREEAKMILA